MDEDEYNSVRKFSFPNTTVPTSPNSNHRRNSVHRRKKTPISISSGRYSIYGSALPLDSNDIKPRNNSGQMLSSQDIISDTQDQIRRNSLGNFSNLVEFARLNKISTKNKIFVNCPETGDHINKESIDLDLSNYQFGKVTSDMDDVESSKSFEQGPQSTRNHG